jgi:hypothetical protein
VRVQEESGAWTTYAPGQTVLAPTPGALAQAIGSNLGTAPIVAVGDAANILSGARVLEKKEPAKTPR